MDFLLIYGPPAVGKLTVAREVARLTGMKLFDNHATVNAVAPIFGFRHEAYLPLLRLMRLAILEAAAKAEIDIVSTLVNNPPASEDYLLSVEELLARYDSKVSLLRLTCSREVLNARVTNEDRTLRSKIDTVAALDHFMTGRNADAPFPGRESLTIDNSHLSPAQVAEAAIAHFGLLPVGTTP